MSVEELKQAMVHLAAAETGGSLKDNNSEPTIGVLNVYPPPEHRKALAGTLGAPWGEKPHPDPHHHGTGTWREFVNDRTELLKRLLAVVPAASAADQALIAQRFDSTPAERHPSHSPLLNPASVKTAHERSLSERVLHLAGRI
jgi:hypothetical protein